jgi:hypothetical protein
LHRPDGELVKTSKFQELLFHVLPTRMESQVFYKFQVDLTNTLPFLEKQNENREETDKISVFHVLLAAGVRTIALRPRINRFVSGRRLWQRNQILLSFVVKKEKTDDGEEVVSMIDFDPFETLESVKDLVNAQIDNARTNENANEKDVKFFGALPRWVIRLIFGFVKWMDQHNHPIYAITKDMPLWCSAFVAHLGSIGMGAAWHHMFELGTAGLFATVGKIHKAAVVDQETGEIEVKKVMDLIFSLDERIMDGVYASTTLELFKELIENPEPLLKPVVLTPEQVAALCLKKR